MNDDTDNTTLCLDAADFAEKAAVDKHLPREKIDAAMTTAIGTVAALRALSQSK